MREVKEEVGLEVTLWEGNKRITYQGGAPYHDRELIPPVGMNKHFLGPEGHQHVDLKYFATTTSDVVIPENKNDEWHWLKKEELNKVELLPNIRFYAELALDTLGRNSE